MTSNNQKNSFGTQSELVTGSGRANFFSLAQLERDGVARVSRMPFTIKVLLEAALRAENGREVTRDDVLKLASYDPADPARLDDHPHRFLSTPLENWAPSRVSVFETASPMLRSRIRGEPCLRKPSASGAQDRTT